MQLILLATGDAEDKAECAPWHCSLHIFKIIYACLQFCTYWRFNKLCGNA